ncbi:hypothetical protein V6R85_20015 [Agrobacterium sp. CCNWLW32]|uniref:hypothetical protein n=1 Tax=Agrobacterium sp. CCNWLW32 TaxID=3122072 RepID=UPI00300FC151
MEEPKRSMSREELYALVWSTPMQKLAEKYGLSDRGLAKTCSRHLIPVPPRGYWAKLSAGQQVKKTKLRPVENVDLHTVHIAAFAPRRSVGAQLALAAQKVQSKTDGWKNQTAVVEPGDDPHGNIRDLVKALRKAKPDDEGLISVYSIAVHSLSINRAITILHNLALIAEEAGASVQVRNDKIYVKDDVGSASLALTEERKRPKHQPTEEELAEYAKLKTKRLKDRERDVWSFARLEPWPEFDVIYTGKLTVSYGGWTQGLRGSWADGKTQTIESLLREIIAGLRLIIAANAEDDRLRKANELRLEALREQAERRRRLEEREVKRIDFLNRLERDRKELTDWQSAVAALPRPDNPPGEYARMIAWAEARAARMEAALTIERIQAELIEQNLYPLRDDLSET